MKTITMKHLVIALLASSCGTALADDHVMLDDASVSIGLFSNNFNSNIRAGGSDSSGTDINTKRDLGSGGTDSLPYLEASWRPWDRHEFTFSYYSDDFSNSKALTRDITFRGETFSLGTQVDSKTSYSQAGIGYRYWLWIGDAGAFALTAGLDVYSFSLRLNGAASVSGPSGSGGVSSNVSVKASTDIPDPSLGVAWRYQMTDWARLKIDAGAFKANVGNVDATLYNGTAGVEFLPWTNVGIVAQYGLSRINANISASDFDGKANLHFDGAQVLLKLRF